MKAIKCCLLIVISIITLSFNLYSETPILNFPQSGETDVSLSPLMSIKFNAIIDTSSITFISNKHLDSNVTPNLILIETSKLDTVGVQNALKYSVSSKMYISLDSNKLNYYPAQPLEPNKSYSLIVNKSLKMFKRNSIDTNLIDTVHSDSTVFRNLFTTVPETMQIKANTIITNNRIMNCNDSIIITFTEKLFYPESIFKDVFTLTKFSHVISTDSNTIASIFDTLTVSPKYIGDSSRVYVKVDSNYDYNDFYNLSIKPEKLVGIPRPSIDYSFALANTCKIDLKFTSYSSNDTLPEINEINGNGQRLLQIGDTLYFNFPKIVDDFYLYKIQINDTNQVEIVNNEMKIVGICSNMRNKIVNVVYNRIPVDTLKLLPITIATNPTHPFIDTCSKYIVSNFKDSINNYRYTYKRFADNDIRISLNSCDARQFHNWISTDSLLNGSVENNILIKRRNDVINHGATIPTGNKVIDIGISMDQTYTACVNKFYRLKVKWIDIDPINSINLTSIFSNLKMNGSNILLNIDPNNSNSATYTTVTTNGSVNFQGNIGNNEIEISALYDMYGKIFLGTKEKYNFTGRVGNSFNETISVGGYAPCQNELCLEIRRKVRKYDVEIVVDNGKSNVPPYKVIRPDIDPLPDPDLNQNIVSFSGNNAPRLYYDIDSLGSKYCSKIVYPYYFYYGSTITTTPFLEEKHGISIQKWSDSAIFTDETIIDSSKKTLQIQSDNNKSSRIMAVTDFNLDFIEICWQKLSSTSNLNSFSYNWTKFRVDADITTNTYPVWLNNVVNPDEGIALGESMTSFFGSSNISGVRKNHKSTTSIRFGFNQEPDLESLIDNISIKELGIMGVSNLSQQATTPITFRADGFKTTTYKPSTNEIYFPNNSYFQNLTNDPGITQSIKTAQFTLINNSNENNVSSYRIMPNLTPFSINIRNRVGSNLRGNNFRRIESKENPGTFLAYPSPTSSRSNNPKLSEEIKDEIYETSSRKAVSGLPSLKVSNFEFKVFDIGGWDDNLSNPDIFIHVIAAISEKKSDPTVYDGNVQNWTIDDKGRIKYKIETSRYPAEYTYNSNGQEFLDENGDQIVEFRELISTPFMKYSNELNLYQDWFDDDYDNGLLNKIISVTNEIQKGYEPLAKASDMTALEGGYLTAIFSAIRAAATLLNGNVDDHIGSTKLSLNSTQEELSPKHNENDYNAPLYFVDDNNCEVWTKPDKTVFPFDASTFEFNDALFVRDLTNWGISKYCLYTTAGRLIQGGGDNKDVRTGTLLDGTRKEFTVNLRRAFQGSYIFKTKTYQGTE